MVLSAIGDIGFAYSTAMGPEIVLRDIMDMEYLL
jgi:hypothetical protein